MSVSIGGRTLTRVELQTLDAVIDYLRKNSGDTHWTNCTSPKGDGRRISVTEIFSERNNQDNARRRTVTRLHRLGILKSCEIELDEGMLRGMPMRSVAPAASAAER